MSWVVFSLGAVAGVAITLFAVVLYAVRRGVRTPDGETKATILVDHRARCVQMVEQHERDRERLNEQYGAPRGWRQPGSKTAAERIAEVDAGIAERLQ